METENGLDVDPSDANVSAQLGHKSSTVLQYYRIKDDRHAVQAASIMMFIFEELGEKEEKKVSLNFWVFL